MTAGYVIIQTGVLGVTYEKRLTVLNLALIIHDSSYDFCALHIFPPSWSKFYNSPCGTRQLRSSVSLKEEIQIIKKVPLTFPSPTEMKG